MKLWRPMKVFLDISKCSQGEISSPILKIGPTKIGYHQKMNEKYPRQKIWIELSIICRFMVNIMAFAIKQQLIDNSIMIITRNDCHVSQLISCWLFNNLFHNRCFYLFQILNNIVHFDVIFFLDTCFCFSSDLSIFVNFCAICYSEIYSMLRRCFYILWNEKHFKFSHILVDNVQYCTAVSVCFQI